MTVEVHELCNLFPEMSKEEFSGLVEDIAKHGQLDPIITHEDRILDGRHRYRACCALGKTPRFEKWTGQGGSVLSFVISRNMHRRSLTAGMRATIALNVKERLEEQARENMRTGGKARHQGSQLVATPIQDARQQAAEMLGVNHQYVTDAENIRDEDPEIFDQVKAGCMTIPQAKRALGMDAKIKPKRSDNPTNLVHYPEDPEGDADHHSRYFNRDYWLRYLDRMAKNLI